MGKETVVRLDLELLPSVYAVQKMPSLCDGELAHVKLSMSSLTLGDLEYLRDHLGECVSADLEFIVK